MLDYDGDVAESFMQPFCVAVVDVFGVPQVHHLKENGDEIIVTNDTSKVCPVGLLRVKTATSIVSINHSSCNGETTDMKLR